MDNVTQREEKVSLAIEIAIKVGLVAMVVYLSYLIAKPFMAIVVWGVIIAVAISPLVDSIEKRLGHRKKIIIAITVAVIAALVLPAYALSGKTFETSQNIMHAMKEGNITIPPPTEKVKEWPVIGEKAYTFWDNASHNLRKTLAPFSDEIKKGVTTLLSSLGGLIGTILMFVGSMIIAAVFLIGSEGAEKFYRAISRRIMGDKGDEWATLSTLTVRSVVMGVIGVAVIQATLALIGMALMGVPLAMVWAIVIMFLTIIQVPALLIIGPVIAYVFSQGSGTAEIIFAIYMIIVGASDGVLKPILMGRGVDVPMLVILIGAIGGMMLMGMIGLFVGAVIFALAYTLFGFWMNEAAEEEEETPAEEA
ncbi:MAG: AI-2E family transporter [Sulfurovum sp.]|nr:MAG: AI-2E family transporter [Sulfurovum sp.]